MPTHLPHHGALGRPGRLAALVDLPALALHGRLRPLAANAATASSPRTSSPRSWHRDVLRRADGLRGQPLRRHLRRGAAGRRRGAQPLAAELLHDHPPAEPLRGLRRLRGALRLRRRRPRTGRLDEEWISPSRTLGALRLAVPLIGNVLGMLWAYEELGWGGLLGVGPGRERRVPPLVTAHRVPALGDDPGAPRHAQGVERLPHLTTFFLTIFGTFLTRSGLIASVHSFAQSGIGIYFVYFMGFTRGDLGRPRGVAPAAAPPRQIDSLLSREAMFVANNWLLLGICVFIVLATTVAQGLRVALTSASPWARASTTRGSRPSRSATPSSRRASPSPWASCSTCSSARPSDCPRSSPSSPSIPAPSAARSRGSTATCPPSRWA
jgi:hypothetical protein